MTKLLSFTKNQIFWIHWISALLLFLVSCRKFVEIKPPSSSLITQTVFQDGNSATATVTAIYSEMVNDFMTYNLSYYPGLYADELENYSSSNIDVAYYRNNLDPVTNNNFALWSNPYKYIYQANAAFEGCDASESLNPKVKKQLMAETRFIRAFWYFYLVNLYGDVPLVTTTNYSVNAQMNRTSVDQVYTQIVTDLKYAEANLNPEYVDNTDTIATQERVRPNKYSAAALLARIYLYVGDYKNSEIEATKVIDNTTLYDTVSLNGVFLKNSREAIWQIPPSSSTINFDTNEGLNYILTSVPTNCTISSQLLNAFEIGDKRKTSWIGSYKDENTSPVAEYLFPYKYRVKNTVGNVKEYTMVLRLAEQYLIRAEARAQQEKIREAKKDLDVIRHRAGLPNTIAETKESLLAAILQERHVELFAEWGHRWFDLKRTGNADIVMKNVAIQKGGSWESYKQLWPLPQTEITNDPNLDQNPNYN